MVMQDLLYQIHKSHIYFSYGQLCNQCITHWKAQGMEPELECNRFHNLLINELILMQKGYFCWWRFRYLCQPSTGDGNHFRETRDNGRDAWKQNKRVLSITERPGSGLCWTKSIFCKLAANKLLPNHSLKPHFIQEHRENTPADKTYFLGNQECKRTSTSTRCS